MGNKRTLSHKIEQQNEKICGLICNKYYSKIEEGYPAYYIFMPKFYKGLIIRLFLLLCKFLRFNKSLYIPYIQILRSTEFPLQKKDSTSLTIQRLKELLMTALGLRYFSTAEYHSSWYENKVPLSSLKFKTVEKPDVSIIIAVRNNIGFTLNCLRSLFLNISEKYSYEIILIDDASSDSTEELLSSVSGIKYKKNQSNLGFLESCNAGAKYSVGRYLCFLNNDTLILKGWLENLVKTLEEDPKAGCTGSKLIYPYGLLQEAGGIIYHDGSGANYGKYNHPKEHFYNFKREVDYCSGASLLINKDDFLFLGGFNPIFKPAYYEDTDLCFSVKYILKKKVLYQPTSVLVHFEGISSGKTPEKGNIKSFQIINKSTFAGKWKKILSADNFRIRNQYVASRKYLSENSIIFIDTNLPYYDKDSGSNRMYQIIKIFLSIGYHVFYIPKESMAPEPYYSELTGMGVEIIYEFKGRKHWLKEIKRAASESSMAWICRPEYNIRYRYLFSINPQLKWIYDTVDLHFVRLSRAIKIFPDDKKLKKRAAKYYKLELSLARKADITICISDPERDLLLQHGITSSHVIPNIHNRKVTEKNAFNKRSGLIFIGGYLHLPNVDAALWLSNEIMPLVWGEDENIQLTLLGSNPPEEITELMDRNKNIHVTGYIPNIDTYFNNARIFVAPLRYGAGLKGKIGQSFEYALPVITTDIGSEGLDLTSGMNIIIANDARSFADQILKLYNDPVLWNTLSNASEDAIKPFSTLAVTNEIQKVISKLQ